ncbi:MAG: hypothetical protein HY908_35230 [Myxococcales bacterium]|nr:hypothetical protein [Myxococcales bacterium]
MAKLGSNMRWQARPSDRDAMRRLFELLGAKRATPAPDLDVYTLDGGAKIGTYYDPAALGRAALERAAWVEFVVEDAGAAAQALAAAGVEDFAYEDRAHRYFRAPNGQIFRLAPAPGGGG